LEKQALHDGRKVYQVVQKQLRLLATVWHAATRWLPPPPSPTHIQTQVSRTFTRKVEAAAIINVPRQISEFSRTRRWTRHARRL
jgi:hypothetical protein